MNKLPAFTLFEMMIVMVLTSIMFAITYTAFRSVSYIHGRQTAASTDLGEIRMLDGVLRQDIDRSQAVREVRTATIECLTPDKSITYMIMSHKVLRTLSSGQTDSFAVDAVPASLSLGYSGAEDGMIDHLSFDVVLGEDRIPLRYAKDYSENLRINNYIDSLSSELH
ncbi:MAG: prepilin-type N-terminal cleavage/methylation domain-containing protein [Bacteroidetes bacterium]|nr:prepilin-type N-terminal cleavage/methylation domain-containing protein [Bacteroidota bacterium]